MDDYPEREMMMPREQRPIRGMGIVLAVGLVIACFAMATLFSAVGNLLMQSCPK